MMRRALPGATTVLVLVAAATLAPSPAHAVLLEPYAEASTSVYPGSGCTMEGSGQDDQEATFTDDGGWTTVTGTLARTAVSSTDAADRTALEASATTQVRATNAAGAFASLEVRGSTRIVRTPDRGADTTCSSSGAAGSRVRTGIVLTQPGWLTVDLAASGTADSYGGAYLRLERLGDSRQVTVATSDGPVSTRVHRPAGAYEVDVELDGDSLYDPGTRENSFSATLTFVPDAAAPAPPTTPVAQAGAATTAAQGRGRSYVALPDGVSCGTGTATLRLAEKAVALKKVRRATFTATGAKAVTLKKAKPGKTVRLRGIATSGPVTIGATFQLANGKKVTVQRSYAACG